MKGGREGCGDVEDALVHDGWSVGEDKAGRSNCLEDSLDLSQLNSFAQSNFIKDSSDFSAVVSWFSDCT